VLRLMTRGLSLKQMAEALNVTVKTVASSAGSVAIDWRAPPAR